MGVLTRVNKSDVKTELEGGLALAEGILKSMGWKNPNVLLVSRLATTLANVVGSSESKPSDHVVNQTKDYMSEEAIY